MGKAIIVVLFLAALGFYTLVANVFGALSSDSSGSTEVVVTQVKAVMSRLQTAGLSTIRPDASECSMGELLAPDRINALIAYLPEEQAYALADLMALLPASPVSMYTGEMGIGLCFGTDDLLAVPLFSGDPVTWLMEQQQI